MTMSAAHLAVVDERKITEYLLNAAHPDNGGKAAFFTRVGFMVQRWKLLADALRALALGGDVVARSRSPHGEKFVVDGEIDAPAGARPRVRSIWIIDSRGEIPRLVTAYPQD